MYFKMNFSLYIAMHFITEKMENYVDGGKYFLIETM